jgi:hypothetical protein
MRSRPRRICSIIKNQYDVKVLLYNLTRVINFLIIKELQKQNSVKLLSHVLFQYP